jgi:type I restriction enzyme R subunit
MSQKFTEAQLEVAFAELIANEGYPHYLGNTLNRTEDEAILADDLRTFLLQKYKAENLTEQEANSIILQIKTLPASDLYESNKRFMSWLSDGFIIKREDHTQKDIYIQLIDFSGLENQIQGENIETLVAEPKATYGDTNIYKFVTQLEITEANQKRIPDGILYINGLPLVVFEFKSAIREEATIHNAYEQLTVRYKRDISQLFICNAFCVISDGVNNKVGSFFAPYEFYYAWRRVAGLTKDVDGIDSMFTLVQGMLHKNRLRDIIRNFIYLPDSSKKDEKILCRYPQYYAARALYENIKLAQKNTDGTGGDGKGGTYFGATGCGKSFTMLFLTRLLMKSEYFGNPTILLITDRTDLDDQLSAQFTNAKNYVGDNGIVSVESRIQLREKLQGCESGGVFLTTIHKFTEDLALLTERTNVICISDEAHRSQTNLDQKVTVTEKGVKKTYGFAKYLHDSLPNATFVGFTGTPIDATLDVFGKVVDAYTMTESVKDEITVRIVYEGRAAKVILNNSELAKIEAYYNEAASEGANDYQVEESKKQSANMNAVLGDPDILKKIANDFVIHYENRVNEGATVKGKAMFVCSSRPIAYAFYQNLIALRPEWAEIKIAEEGANLTDRDKKEIKPMQRVKMIMTRSKDDPKEMYNMLGSKDYRKELDRQFKNEKSNFKIAILVDMWLTGFDVPFLDSMYIYKPISQHNLIQTISRVNRKFAGKNKGLVVDYIGIKKAMNLALAKYNKGDQDNFEDIDASLSAVRDQLDVLAKIFHKFDSSKYFNGSPLDQLNTLNKAAEHAQITKAIETRFMGIVKRLKAAYDICAGNEKLTQTERDYTHFYLAVRSIVFKLTKGNAPDTAQMNKKVREMIKDALQSDNVEEIFKIGEDADSQQDIFDDDYLAKLDKIKMPNTKIKLLQQLLAKAIGEIKKVNQVKGVDFTKKMETLVANYNDRSENDVLRSEVYDEMADALTDIIMQIRDEFDSGDELGIDFEEKAFYDILLELCKKYDFTYPKEKLIDLAKKVKELVDSQAKFPDWSKRDDIKSALKVGLILLLDEFGYPPVDKDEVYQEIFTQAENYKKYNTK